jgi:hypothetical protein
VRRISDAGSHAESFVSGLYPPHLRSRPVRANGVATVQGAATAFVAQGPGPIGDPHIDAETAPMTPLTDQITGPRRACMAGGSRRRAARGRSHRAAPRRACRGGRRLGGRGERFAITHRSGDHRAAPLAVVLARAPPRGGVGGQRSRGGCEIAAGGAPSSARGRLLPKFPGKTRPSRRSRVVRCPDGLLVCDDRPWAANMLAGGRRGVSRRPAGC